MSKQEGLIAKIKTNDISLRKQNIVEENELAVRAEKLEKRCGERPLAWDEYCAANPMEAPKSRIGFATRTALILGGIGLAVAAALVLTSLGLHGAIGPEIFAW